jgi:hypothetical protein
LQVLEERADGRETSLDAARPEAGSVAARGEAAHMAVVQLRPVFKTLLFAPCGQGREVALIGRTGVGGQAPLLRQVTQELRARFSRARVHR